MLTVSATWLKQHRGTRREQHRGTRREEDRGARREEGSGEGCVARGASCGWHGCLEAGEVIGDLRAWEAELSHGVAVGWRGLGRGQELVECKQVTMSQCF